MSIAFFAALIVTIIGLIPLYFKPDRWVLVPFVGIIGGLVSMGLFYLVTPSFGYPLGGAAAGFVFVYWVICGILASTERYESSLDLVSTILGTSGIILYCLFLFATSEMTSSNTYASLLGQVDKRQWTQDVQPKDPKHVRLVPRELALYQADKQLGEAPGALGSQYQVDRAHVTLQMIKGELWYVAPLQYVGFWAWSAKHYTPGYVMVHGEDPVRPAIVKYEEKFKYVPSACFDEDLERHLWTKGYALKILDDYNFEIDEAGKPWWVVTVCTPAVGYTTKPIGAVLVNPVDGAITYYPLGEVPAWVDRVIPSGTAKSFVTYWGKYQTGWLNTLTTSDNLIEPEEPTVIYGDDGQPYWVMCLTSSNKNDDSMIGLIYMNSRTGQVVQYQAKGLTESAVVAAVNSKVGFKNWHGASPVLYNIYGQMAAIVPVLGGNSMFQEVAIVNVANGTVVSGKDQYMAYREFQRTLNTSGQQVAPDKAHGIEKISGIVSRIAGTPAESDVVYYVYLVGHPHLFRGVPGRNLSEKLRITQPGDHVMIEYVKSGEDVEEMQSFDNEDLVLESSANQEELRRVTKERTENLRLDKERHTLEVEIRTMTERELKDLLEAKKRAENQ